MMRNALIDHVRAKRSNKRSHHKVELLTNIPDAVQMDVEDLVAAMDRLAQIDAERAHIVEMRYFGGMAIKDIAIVLDISESTVKRRWEAARLWLFDALEQASA
ncbi:RNA polymerase sigma factor (sigma-70 family) [Sphingobium boeckii]|uniref:RNA polymerase sigma factor (Sigma-70 family) n=2 Tax=Sphingobium boeckii TaxID=1082345 RepID=A0A7W9EDA6_9SPHN|nr:RNA polymerase sigma factor (sigma-70 family) [Sphingobium boeckii]